jgi:glycosyltransferase involved in cell wall biosynthesis
MKKKPMFSVLLPSHNGARFLPISLGSLAYQTDKDFEVILVDNASTDNTLEVMELLRHKIGAAHGTRIIRRKTNSGHPAFSDGFGEARGEFACFFSDDDYYMPRRFEQMRRFLSENPAVDWAHEDVHIWNAVTNKIELVSMADYAGLPPHAMLEDFMKGRFPVWGAMALRTSLVKKLGGISSTLHYCEDLDMWLRLINNNTVLHKRWGEAGYVYRDRPMHWKPIVQEARARDILKAIWSCHENATDPKVRELSKKYHDQAKLRFSVKKFLRPFMR